MFSLVSLCCFALWRPLEVSNSQFFGWFRNVFLCLGRPLEVANSHFQVGFAMMFCFRATLKGTEFACLGWFRIVFVFRVTFKGNGFVFLVRFRNVFVLGDL
jgi:hypothetical protein